ncbi:unnamed protein product, partial [Brassica rapa subsp. trilocularis]
YDFPLIYQKNQPLSLTLAVRRRTPPRRGQCDASTCHRLLLSPSNTHGRLISSARKLGQSAETPPATAAAERA